MTYKPVKFNTLGEGDKFWFCEDSAGQSCFERILRGESAVFTDGHGKPYPMKDIATDDIVYIKEIEMPDEKELQENLSKVDAEYAAITVAIRELNTRLSVLGDTKNALKKQIAEAEVFYSIGDRFTFMGNEYLLVYCGGSSVVISNMKTGGSPISSRSVANTTHITSEELKTLCGGRDYTRTWDAQKECNV